MSRLSSNIQESFIHPEEKASKVVLWDYDSVIHHCLYSGKDEFGNKNPEYTEDDLEMLQGKLTEMTLKVLNKVEEYYTIQALYIFVKGKGTFRKELYPEYKSNRPTPNPLINKLYEYAKLAHNTIHKDGYEAEDIVYTFSKKLEHNGLIVFCDHDLEEIPSLMYNFQKDVWKKLTKEEALHNKYCKLIIGEAGDNANFTPKIGISYFNKNFTLGMSVEEYELKTKETFLKCWKTEEKAEEMLNLAKQIIWLKEIETNGQSN